MASMKIKKGDLVQVISGRTSDADRIAARNKTRADKGKSELTPGDKGKQGRVLEVFPDTQRVIVEGVNRITRHNKPGMNGQAGGIEQVEAPIHVSNVAIVDPEDNKPTRVGFREETVELENGRTKTMRVRISKRTGKDI
ncbi:50S ribosomal protein L24 [Helcobacillus massiliensis]|uniref:Large ribosomal subunit protein uL24 n=1 Tax=Helcobacillus massiliensis TaxID=521392 RepID=A0A839QZV9_9MICO|nr:MULTISPECIES: 50S ribosomal protein L24 [Helcobacillus]MBB3022937.1 large subunit ribosomal protein L24 [Helcobacillus massiliensis]MCG7426213.1 50S ribosomal protein L24 [Helcobacillus sp. ACRRO]MCT1558553.1 50S ribosomal protein L24 [Helcobacillus massiliensis]MCT2037203.1 50S ribosomal protein L24 [Helcobacillus massiliensis]MCT2332377.1 50S ribosomal protein L24 [Helcobacillus massiliensis]